MKAYGPHLTMDFVGCNPAKTSSARFIYEFMSDLPSKIGMKKIGEPHIDFYNGKHDELGGFSATIHITTSHITFHFFDYGHVFADIFSCKEFDCVKAYNYIKKALEADKHQPNFKFPKSKKTKSAIEFLKDKKSEYRLVERGFNFPPSIK